MTCPPPITCHTPVLSAYHATAKGVERPSDVREDVGQPPVTRSELSLYTIKEPLGAPFPRVRSDWGSRVTADTENNPLIGLPNQHIVGLTYVP
ncbi:hypothetical protein GCM10020295_08970 [Streptomyces cinereospinus]